MSSSFSSPSSLPHSFPNSDLQPCWPAKSSTPTPSASVSSLPLVPSSCCPSSSAPCTYHLASMDGSPPKLRFLRLSSTLHSILCLPMTAMESIGKLHFEDLLKFLLPNLQEMGSMVVLLNLAAGSISIFPSTSRC